MQKKSLFPFRPSFPVTGMLLLILLLGAAPVFGMTRTLKKEPAIVIVAFGTTTRAMVTYDVFEKQLRRELPEKYRKLRIEWAFTSEIVRERANRKFREQGLDRRFLSLPQVLANLENDGYRKVAIQSLHIFPGQEFADMERQIAAFRQLGLRIEYGGTLLHEWPWVFETVDALEPYFLPPEQGCNVLVVHGTPKTFPGSNATYLGLDRYLSAKYDNVFVGGVDGVLTREQALDKARACKVKRVRLIPFMYVAGAHIMDDIMGRGTSTAPSWAMELKQAGIEVDSLTVEYQGKTYYRGLGFYESINRNYIRQLEESLTRLAEQ